MNQHSLMAKVVHVDDENTLHQLSSHWQSQKWLTLDTEFIRCGTFYPEPALIQVYDGKTISLIDPVNINDWSCFKTVLQKRSLLKIMHAPSEDIDVFQHLTGTAPKSIVDVQLAAAFCNMRYSLSYKSLLSELLNININKQAVRSDWMKRPLTEAQTDYAAGDVYYLEKVYEILKKRISDNFPQKTEWFLQECRTHFEKANTPEDNWKESSLACILLTPGQRTVLKALYLWRERYIRQNNIPRNKTFNGSQLVDLSRKQPSSVRTLQSVENITPRQIRCYGKKILSVIDKAKKKSAICQSDLSTRVSAKKAKVISTYVQKQCLDLCEQYKIHSAILSGKKITSFLIQSYLETGIFALPSTIAPWKTTLLKQTMDNLNAQYGYPDISADLE